MIPIWLDVTGRHVIIVGLGPVGQRRALQFQRAGALVTGVDPLPRIQGQEWGELIRNGLELQSQPYHISIFEELSLIGIKPQLALACANPTVNKQVVADCRQLKIWASTSTFSENDPADFQLGAVARGESMAVCVHSDRSSPGLSSSVRDEIAETLLPAADRLAKLASFWRPRILNEIADDSEKKRLLDLFSNRAILKSEVQNPGTGEKMIQSELDCARELFP